MKEPLSLDITQEERENLKIEFKQLGSVRQKIQFWIEKLKRNYSFWAFYDPNNISDFKIDSQDESEIEILNKYIYSEFIHFPSSSNEPSINELKRSFVDKMDSSTNKEALIEYELKNIDDTVFKRKQVSISDNWNQYERNDFFIGGYEYYLKTKKELDWKERVYQGHLLHEKMQGIELAKYREFVKSSNPNKKQDVFKLNGEQKFLVLHYLGFGKDTGSQKTLGMLYEIFIEELKFSSIRPMISDIAKYETVENLNTIIDLFRLLKLNTKARELEDKLPKKRQS